MDRIVYLDYLRVFATFAVVMLHVSAFGFRETYPSVDWQLFNLFNGMSRWGVPIFVMISGALFLNESKVLDVQRLYKRNIKRMVFAFLFWSTAYALIVGIIVKHNSSPIYIIGRIIHGESHLWFLLMIIGLYMFLPVIKPFVNTKRHCEYFLLFSVLTTFIIPLMFDAINIVLPSQKEAIGVVKESYDTMGISFSLGFTGYFVLGHYLHRYVKIYSKGGALYIILVVVLMSAIFLTSFVSDLTNHANKYLYGNLRPLVLVESICIFLIVRQLGVCNVIRNSINHISSVSFGIYLVHFIFIIILDYLDLYPYKHALMTPLISLAVFLVSYVIALYMYKIPIARKYIL